MKLIVAKLRFIYYFQISKRLSIGRETLQSGRAWELTRDIVSIEGISLESGKKDSASCRSLAA